MSQVAGIERNESRHSDRLTHKAHGLRAVMSIVPPFDLWRRPYPEISSKHSITVYVNSSHLSPLTLATYLASLCM